MVSIVLKVAGVVKELQVDGEPLVPVSVACDGRDDSENIATSPIDQNRINANLRHASDRRLPAALVFLAIPPCRPLQWLGPLSWGSVSPDWHVRLKTTQSKDNLPRAYGSR